MTDTKSDDLRRPERSRSHGRPDCHLCGGTGWMETTTDPNTVVPCACRERWDRESTSQT
jgi:hypothetical protein